MILCVVRRYEIETPFPNIQKALCVLTAAVTTVNAYNGFVYLQTVVLDSAVDPESAANKGNVERWLLELEAMQWQSVRTQVTLSLKEYPTISREQWVLNWPAQAVLGVSQVSIICMHWRTAAIFSDDISPSWYRGSVRQSTSNAVTPML